MTVILFPEPMTLHRWTGNALDGDGFAIKTGQSITSLAGSVQPVSRYKLDEDLAAEGVEKIAFIDTALYTTPRPASIDGATPADEIVFNGETYRVVKTEVWTTGLAHCRAYLTRRLT